MTSTIRISRQRLQNNVLAIGQALAEAVASSASPPALLAVIKANAYGHGATVCAPILAQAGVPWLGVTDAEEGVAVRQSLASNAPRILIMSGPPGDHPSARQAASHSVAHHLTPTVWTPAQLTPVAEAASDPHPIHLELDTGMSRQGVAPGPALDAFLDALQRHPQLTLDGVFTHLASAECANARQTKAQFQLFASAVAAIHHRGFHPTWLHLGNASTIDNAAPAAAPTIARLHALAASIAAKPLVRCGLALYGVSLPIEFEGPGGPNPEPSAHSRLHARLRPVLHWNTTITSTQLIPAGASVGYSAAYTATHPMRLALLPVGYADGLRRGLSSTNLQSGGWVIIHGQRAPIIGRISMNLTTVDVTDIHPPPQPGDTATLLGDGITAEDHGRLAHALPYEILCGLRAPIQEAAPPTPAATT